MGKRFFHSGYTMIEMIMVLLVISIMMLMSVPIMKHHIPPSLLGSYMSLQVLSTQQEAVLNGEAQALSFQEMMQQAGLTDWHVVTTDEYHINQRGNINRGGTIHLEDEADHGLTITIWIGFGRTVCEW